MRNGSGFFTLIRIRIHLLKTMRIHDDPDPQPCLHSNGTVRIAKKQFPFSLLRGFKEVLSVLIVLWLPGEPVELLPVKIELAELGHRLEPQPLVLNIFIPLQNLHWKKEGRSAVCNCWTGCFLEPLTTLFKQQRHIFSIPGSYTFAPKSVLNSPYRTNLVR